MLQKLSIQNIAIIEKVSIDFSGGLNVLTGETGAGKSIIIDSLNAILGERTSKELIRRSANKAFVEALFSIENHLFSDLFVDYGIDPEEDGMLLLQREFYSTGKNICRINGRMVTVSILKAFGDRLVDVHGQHDNQSLLFTEKHIDLLDNFAGSKLRELHEQYLSNLQQYKSIVARIKELSTSPSERERRMDILRFQIEEISKAKLIPNEDAALLSQRTLLSNSERIKTTLASIYDAIYGGTKEKQTAYDIMRSAIKELSSITSLGAIYTEVSDKLSEISYLLEDVVDLIRKAESETDFSPEDLESIDERIDTLVRLKKKYGKTIEEILAFYAGISKELNDMENNDSLLLSLQDQLQTCDKSLFAAAKDVHASRVTAAQLLEKKITSELHDLEIKNAQFKVQLAFDDSQEDGMRNFNRYGLSRAEFLISTNAGEPLKPLAKIASGGEMSRIMLAIKSILAKIDMIGTLIFDEIDTGISGRAAQKVANKLAYLSSAHQVICITHLPHIAAMADAHYLIEKSERGGHTFTDVKRLEAEALKAEIARIIGGSHQTDLTLRHAEEMLHLAQKLKAEFLPS